ncbi:MAG TPA: hypothetical protein VL588_12310 [Bdellovibrionota bacterium]|jgi:hypothetical protein|nr:hypothetical protein [Bdellovibrionota bacterium]
MKGTFFQKTLEFRLAVDGESWRQGTAVVGTLQVRNHGPEPIPASDLRVTLAHGTDRKVKAKAADAFKTVGQFKPESGSLVAPGALSEGLGWKFTLEANAPVTDRAGSLYLLYGRGDDLAAHGHLQLKVVPQHPVEDLIEVMTTTFHFAVKHILAGKKGEVEVKFTPPDGKTYGFVEQLELSLIDQAGDIAAEFDFLIKQIDATQPGLGFKKVSRKLERVFARSEMVHGFNGRLNKDAAEAALRGVLDELQKSKQV